MNALGDSTGAEGKPVALVPRNRNRNKGNQVNATTTTATTGNGRRAIGPCGDAGGLTLQTWRQRARVAVARVETSEARAEREGRRDIRQNVGLDSAKPPIDSASAWAAGKRVQVRVSGGGGASRPILARKARPSGSRPLLRVDVDGSTVRETGQGRAVHDAEGEDGLLSLVGGCDSPLFEGLREVAAGPRVASGCFVEDTLRTLGLHPNQPLPVLTGAGPVARAWRDTMGLRSSRRMVRTMPSETSIRDARDAGAACVAVFLSDFVTQLDASLRCQTLVSTLADRVEKQGKRFNVPDSLQGCFSLWVWLIAYRATRRELRAFRASGLAKRDPMTGERLPVVVGGDEAEGELAKLIASPVLPDDKSLGQRALAFRMVRQAVSTLGCDIVNPTARTKTKLAVRSILRVVARVVVGGDSLERACEAEGTTLDAIAQRADRCGFWTALDDWQREQRVAASLPLRWLGVACAKLRRARAAMPTALAEPLPGPHWMPRPDAAPGPGRASKLPRGQGVIVRQSRPVSGCLPVVDAGAVGAASLASAKGAQALADLMAAREAVTLYGRLAARSLANGREDWRGVTIGWRQPGKAKAKRKA